MSNSALSFFLNLLLKFIYPIKLYLFGFCVVSFLCALETPLRPYLIKLFINAATIKETDLLFSNLCKTATYIILIQCSIHACKRFSEWCYTKVELHFKGNVLKDVLNHILLQEYNFFENKLIGGIGLKISIFVNTMQIILIIFIRYISNIICIIVSFIFLYYVNPLFSFAIMIWGSFIIIISALTLRHSSATMTELSEITASIKGNIVDILSNISDVILFSSVKQELERLEEYQKNQEIKIKKHHLRKLKFYSVQGVSFIIYQSICLGLLIFFYIHKTVTIGDFAFILAINLAILDRFWGLSDQMTSLIDSWSIVKQIIKVFYEPKRIENNPNALTLKISKGSIVFDKVNFSYTDFTTKLFFENQSIHIEGGQKVGLIGYSGGGKSTFINLIVRLHDINSGKILIDGQDIRSVTKNSLRNLITVVSQNPFLFHRSLIENIRYGRPDATENEVIEAAKKAYIHDFILTLPEGYNTVVGNRGLQISGGQRQKIVIARAVLKNSPILILDEPTSQLDYITEQNIQKSLRQLMKGKTTLIIAHRLATLSFMDRIIVFDQGKIVEDGSPDELLSKKGLYEKFWNLPMF